MKYPVNSKVIHALHGLGTVESIRQEMILGQTHRFATVFFPDDCLRVMINVDQRHEFIRPAKSRQEVEKLLEYLAAYRSDAPTRATWRQKYNLRKIKSGLAEELCEVIKSLVGLASQGRLTKREQAMYVRARAVLASELEHALAVDPDEAQSRIDRACGLSAQEPDARVEKQAAG